MPKTMPGLIRVKAFRFPHSDPALREHWINIEHIDEISESSHEAKVTNDQGETIKKTVYTTTIRTHLGLYIPPGTTDPKAWSITYHVEGVRLESVAALIHKAKGGSDA